MTKRRLLIALLLVAVGLLLLLFLKPCAPQPATTTPVGVTSPPADAPHAKSAPPQKPSIAMEKDKEKPPATTTPAPSAEVDSAPPVELSAGDTLPDIAKCVATKFPAEAKPYVKSATVTVRLVVDKFGNVRSVKTTAVDFVEEPAEDILPMLRKAFIQAGNRAFGTKKCPPHIVKGQAVGYAIEVPLQYKH